MSTYLYLPLYTSTTTTLFPVYLFRGLPLPFPSPPLLLLGPSASYPLACYLTHAFDSIYVYYIYIIYCVDLYYVFVYFVCFFGNPVNPDPQIIISVNVLSWGGLIKCGRAKLNFRSLSIKLKQTSFGFAHTNAFRTY